MSHLGRRLGSTDGLGRVLHNRGLDCRSFLDGEFLSGGSPGLLSGTFLRSTFCGAVRLCSRSLLSRGSQRLRLLGPGGILLFCPDFSSLHWIGIRSGRSLFGHRVFALGLIGLGILSLPFLRLGRPGH